MTFVDLFTFAQSYIIFGPFYCCVVWRCLVFRYFYLFFFSILSYWHRKVSKEFLCDSKNFTKLNLTFYSPPLILFFFLINLIHGKFKAKFIHVKTKYVLKVFSQKANFLKDYLLERLTARKVNWLEDWLHGRLTVCMVNCMKGKLYGRLTAWKVNCIEGYGRPSDIRLL